MIPLRTALILLSVFVIAAFGCARLPSRGLDGAKVDLQLEPADVAQSDTDASPALSGVSESGQRPPSPVADASKTTEAPVSPTAQAIAQKKFDAAPVAEMSAFIKELEGASHIDAATRSKIMATTLRTPVDQQAELIQQYRALLALGRSATETPPAATTPATTMPATVPLPDESTPSPEAATVVAASHAEPIQAPEKASLPAKEDLSDLESQLRALLHEMKGDKVEAASHTAMRSESDDRVSVDRTRSDSQALSDASWEELVDSAIKKLEERKDRRLDSDLREEDEARLRMLYLIADRRDDAVRTIASLEPEMQEFWSKQFFGLATLLNSELISDRSNRLIESKRNLDEALRRLGESSPLFVRNLAFVTEVQSYGAYTPFDDYEFRPGEPVLLYAEVENYRCKETARGYHTALRSTYEIFDSSRQKVAEHDFATNEEYCKNARRDFFTICEFRIPEKLHPGKFELRLTVADLNGDKAGESSITFHIRDGS